MFPPRSYSSYSIRKKVTSGEPSWLPTEKTSANQRQTVPVQKKICSEVHLGISLKLFHLSFHLLYFLSTNEVLAEAEEREITSDDGLNSD